MTENSTPEPLAPLDNLQDRTRIASMSDANVFSPTSDPGYTWEHNGQWWPFRAQRYFDVDMATNNHKGTRYRSWRYLIDTAMVGNFISVTELSAIARDIDPTHILLRPPRHFRGSNADLVDTINWEDYHGTVIVPLHEYSLTLDMLDQKGIGPRIRAVAVSGENKSAAKLIDRLHEVKTKVSFGTEVYITDTFPTEDVVNHLAANTDLFDAFILPSEPPLIDGDLPNTTPESDEPNASDTSASSQLGEKVLTDSPDYATLLAGEMSYLFSPLSQSVTPSLLEDSLVPAETPTTAQRHRESDARRTVETAEDFSDLPEFITNAL